MPEPAGSTAAVVATTTGLTLLGVATGLDEAVLIASFAGALWAQTYHDEVTLPRRIALMIAASLAGGYLAPVGVLAAQVIGPDVSFAKLPFAFIIGFTAHRSIGPRLNHWVAKHMDERKP